MLVFSCFLYIFQVTYPAPRQQASWSLEDLPRTVAFTLHQGSTVTSMDFHPTHHTLLLGNDCESYEPHCVCHIPDFLGEVLRFKIFLYCSIFTYWVFWTVGSNNGEVTLWELGLRERVISKPFKIWDMTTRPLAFQVLF